MSSDDHVLSQRTFTYRVVKRAQYEAHEFTVDTRGVRVRNASHANPDDHEYLVTIRDGIPVACECPADTHCDGACKHRVGVAIRTPLLKAAAEYSLVADGGTQPKDGYDHSGDGEDTGQTSDCECADLGGFPCWDCVRTGRRDLPDE
ncbi:SWIM zinc finger family protein [Haladaptatus sp. NG-SE-30]